MNNQNGDKQLAGPEQNPGEPPREPPKAPPKEPPTDRQAEPPKEQGLAVPPQEGFRRPSTDAGGDGVDGVRKPPPSRYIQTTEDDKNSAFEKCATCFCWVFVLLFFPCSLCCCIIVVPEFTRLIILRLGRLRKGAKGPGMVFHLPCIDEVTRVDMRTDVHNVWPQDVLTKDSVTITVNAVIYFCIYDPIDSLIQVDDVEEATRMIAKVTLRNIVGSKTLNVLLTSRQSLSREIQQAVAGITARWGVLVERVDIMDIRLPPSMERSLASEAEAVREARAKIILAEGELKASRALKEASDVMSQNKITLQLRHLQILSSIASERRVRIIYPIPLEIMEPFMDDKNKRRAGGSGGGGGPAGGGGTGVLSNFFFGGKDEDKPGGNDAAEPKGSDEPGSSGAVVPAGNTETTNQRSSYVAVDIDQINRSPANFMQREHVAEDRQTRSPLRRPSGPVGRLAFMDLQSYRDFLRVRW